MARFEGGNKGTIWVALNSLFTRKFATVADLRTDTELTYARAQDGTTAAGDIVEAGGHRYEVLPLGAASSIVHISTPGPINGLGGVLLKVLPGPDGAVNVGAWGLDDTGVADESAKFASAVATGAKIVVPAGTFKASFDLGNNQQISGQSREAKTILIPAAGAAYVIRVDARTTFKRGCSITDLKIDNPNAVANCAGIQFAGTDVNSINDWHYVENVWINGFRRGIEITGRMIWSTFINVEALGGTTPLWVTGDPATGSFNQNVFIQCRFASCAREGVRIIGQGTTNMFLTCDFEICNSDNVANVAAVYLEDLSQTSFIGCYWENNGTGVAVDTGTVANNSIGLKLSGYNYNTTIDGAFFVTSGVLIWAEGDIRGGVIRNSLFTPLTGGVSFWVTSTQPDGAAPGLTWDSSNFTGGLIKIIEDVNGNYNARVAQGQGCLYMAVPMTVDLMQWKTLIVTPNGTTFTGISSFTNMIPGMELTVINTSATNTFTINAGLVSVGTGVVGTNSSRRYIVAGFPWGGKLVEV